MDKGRRSVIDQLRRLNQMYTVEDEEVGEEGTEAAWSSSALTDSFRERLSEGGKKTGGLLAGFLSLLDGWAEPGEGAERRDILRGEEELDVEGGSGELPFTEEEVGLEEEGGLEEGEESKQEAEEAGAEEAPEEKTEEEPKGGTEEEEAEAGEPGGTEEGRKKTSHRWTLRKSLRQEEVERILSQRDTPEEGGQLKADLWELRRQLAYKLIGFEAPRLLEELSQYSEEPDRSTLDLSDLAQIFRSFGSNPTEAQLKEIVSEIKLQYGGDKIDVVSFLPYLLALEKKTPSTRDILGAFRALDVRGGGQLKRRLLRRILMGRGEKLNEQEWDAFLKEADTGKTGIINYSDLVHRMDRNLYIASPEKRGKLLKLLRKEDRRAARDSKSSHRDSWLLAAITSEPTSTEMASTN